MIPAILAGFILTPEILVYSSTFLLGAVFFGDPILTRGLDWLNRTIPNWASYLDLRKYEDFSPVPSAIVLTVGLVPSSLPFRPVLSSRLLSCVSVKPTELLSLLHRQPVNRRRPSHLRFMEMTLPWMPPIKKFKKPFIPVPITIKTP